MARYHGESTAGTGAQNALFRAPQLMDAERRTPAPNGGYLKRFACTFGSQCLTIVGIIDP